MATFHLTDLGGATYEVEAPDEHAAMSAFTQMQGGNSAQPASTPASTAEQPKGMLQTADNYVRALANGMTFGLADRVAAGMGSLTGVGGKSGDYAGNLQEERTKTKDFSDQHPIASTATNIVGSAAAPLGAIGAAAKGASFGAKTLLGIGAGAGIGGVEGAAESPDWTDVGQTAKDAAVGVGGGALVGGLLPGAGKIIGSGFNKVANAVRGGAGDISRGATSHLVSALEADTPQAVHTAVNELGPQGMLADTGPAMLGKTQGASLNSDEARSIAQGALRTRDQGTNTRIAADVNGALGPAEDPQVVSDAIRAHRSAVDAQNYGQALGPNAPPVDTTNVLTHLGPMIGNSVGMENRALTNMRDMMMTTERRPRIDANTGYQATDSHGNLVFDQVPVPQTNPAILHKIKGELDNVIQYDQPGLGVPAAALSRQQGALTTMRGHLNDALEQQVPGYADANAASAALARRGEAVQQGTQYLGSGKTTPSPDRFADEFGQRAPGEQIAFAKGSRGNIDRVLGTKSNDLQALRSELQGEGGWNTAKLATVHGQPAADELVNSVDRNLRFRGTFNNVVNNSQTAQRQAAADAMKPGPPSEAPWISPQMNFIGLLSTIAKKGTQGAYNALTHSDPTRDYGEIAKVLTAQGPQRDQYLRSLSDVLAKRTQDEAMSQKVGDRSALAGAIAANAYLRDRNRTPLSP